MSLTPTAAWLAAFGKATVRPRFLVDIYDGTNTWRATSGSMESTSDLFSVPEGVVDASSVGAEVDPLTRELSTDELFVDFQDAFLRPIIVSTHLRSKTMTVHLGAAELSEADFLDHFTGAIEEIIPRGNGVIGLTCATVFRVLALNLISGYWIGKHPLQCLYAGDGTGILEKGGATSFNTASFDPTSATYTGDISHLKVCRGGSVNEPWGAFVVANRPALEVAQEICQLLNGHLVTDESGALKFVRFNSATAAVDAWTEDDIIAGSFSQEKLEGVVNRIVCKFGESADGYTEQYETNETASQTTYAFPGGAATRVISHEMETPWLSSMSHLYADIAGNAVSLISWGNNESFAGNGANAWETVSAARPAYLLLDSAHIWTKGWTEIVRATGCTRDTTKNTAIQILDPATNSTITTSTFCRHLTYTGLTSLDGTPRALYSHLGYNATGPSPTIIYDVTSLVLLADELLARFKDGCPIIELDTLLTKARRQLGDLVTVTWPGYVGYGKDGISAEKWEILGKEIAVINGAPRTHWKLGLAVTAAPTRTARGIGRYNEAKRTVEAVAMETVQQAHVGAGLTVTDAGGLTATIAVGESRSENRAQKVLAAYTHTFPASRDTYISQSLIDGALVFQDVALAAAAPMNPASEAFIAMVKTGAAAITSISTTGKETLPVEGSKLKAGTGPLTCLAQTTGYLDNLQHVTTRSFDDVQDGTYFKRLYGVTANGMLAADEDRGGNLIPNSTFSAWESVNQMPVGWTVGAGTPGTDVLLDDTTANTIGDLVLQFDATTPANNPYLISADYIAVERSAPYRLSGLVQVDDVADADVFLYVNWYQKNKTYISASVVLNSEAPASGSWLELSAILSAPSNAQFAKVVIGKEKTAFHCYFDWVKLERAPRAFMVHLNANQAATKGGYRQVLYDDASVMNFGSLFDTTGGHNHATITKAGLYAVAAVQHVTVGATAEDAYIAMFVNGSQVLDGDRKYVPSGGACRLTLAHPDYYFARGDVVDIRVQVVAEDFTIGGGPTLAWFTMREKL